MLAGRRQPLVFDEFQDDFFGFIVTADGDVLLRGPPSSPVSNRGALLWNELASGQDRLKDIENRSQARFTKRTRLCSFRAHFSGGRRRLPPFPIQTQEETL